MWLDAAEGHGDEDASWAETALGTDPGPGGLTPAQTRRRTVRRREVYASLIALTDCEDLKAVLRDEAQRNGREAWRILERECGEPTSALHMNKKILEWHGLTMAKDVGISPSSITDFNRLLTRKNSELGGMFDTDAIVEKLLGAIVVPSTLASNADGLLQAEKDDLPENFYDQPVAAAGALPAVPGGWEPSSARNPQARVVCKTEKNDFCSATRASVTPINRCLLAVGRIFEEALRAVQLSCCSCRPGCQRRRA